jgi:uncharacterized protein (UPF0276 family)
VKFALNYSPQAADLLRRRAIEIDLFKCPDWPDTIEEARRQRPVYIHFPLVAGQQNRRVNLHRVADLRASTSTPYVNTHLAARYQDLDDPQNAQAAAAIMLRDLMPLVEQFGPGAVMAENVPCPDIWNDKPPVVTKPDVICRVIHASGCGLLLDLAHARLSSSTLGMDVYDYITRLPVDRLCELHVTGVGLNREGLREDHLPMTNEDWALFDWAMANIRAGRWAKPAIVACEYGGIGPIFDWRTDPAVIARDIPRMYQAVASS